MGKGPWVGVTALVDKAFLPKFIVHRRLRWAELPGTWSPKATLPMFAFLELPWNMETLLSPHITVDWHRRSGISIPSHLRHLRRGALLTSLERNWSIQLFLKERKLSRYVTIFTMYNTIIFEHTWKFTDEHFLTRRNAFNRLHLRPSGLEGRGVHVDGSGVRQSDGQLPCCQPFSSPVGHCQAACYLQMSSLLALPRLKRAPVTETLVSRRAAASLETRAVEGWGGENGKWMYGGENS